MRRRTFLLGGASALAACGGYTAGVEPSLLERTVTDVRVPGTASAGVTILHLSDLHVTGPSDLSLVARAVALGLAANPDVCCLTGDYVTRGRPFDRDAYVAVLGSIAGRVPVFACTGNHDGDVPASMRSAGRSAYDAGGSAYVRALLADAGVTVLHNRSAEVVVRGTGLTMVGLGDIWAGECRPDEAFPKAPRTAAGVVVLSHNPDAKERLGRYDWDMMLCGHTHGGQIKIPFLGAPLVAVRDRAYAEGLNPWEGRQIYTTRGVGSLLGVRFNCRPEVTLLRLKTLET